jgi:phosphatidylglycerophosphatase C
MNLALFDFDGTVTTTDSFTPFLYFTASRIRIALGTALLAPMIAGYEIGLIAGTRMRAAGAWVCFRGRSEAEINELGARYAERLDAWVRPEMRSLIRSHQANGDQVVIVSASLGAYLDSWCRRTGVERISTELEAKAGVLTGRYAHGDCTGPEKARRVLERYDLARYSTVYAYGDTPEDEALLKLANRRFMRGRDVLTEPTRSAGQSSTG